MVLTAEPGLAGADYVGSDSVLSIWPLGMKSCVDRQLLGGAQSTLCKDASSGTYRTGTGCRYNYDRPPVVLHPLGLLVEMHSCPAAAVGHLGTIQPVGGWDLPGSASRHGSHSGGDTKG